jgi:AraC family transcriptional regulator
MRPTARVQWKEYDGLVGAFWQAESEQGARGYYRASHPHIMVFFDDMSDHFRMSNDERHLQYMNRPMARAIYVPAGRPMWTASLKAHRFSHLNLYIHSNRLRRFLSLSVGSSAAQTLMDRPVELDDAGAIGTLAGLLIDELRTPSRHPLYSESLVGSIAAGLLNGPHSESHRNSGSLNKTQMERLSAYMTVRCERRVTVSEMADSIGLPESLFSDLLKQTTGKTPLQWQRDQRVAHAQNLLAETEATIAFVSTQLGFTDQAHFTKVFRQVVGTTPAAWRKLRFESRN